MEREEAILKTPFHTNHIINRPDIHVQGAPQANGTNFIRNEIHTIQTNNDLVKNVKTTTSRSNQRKKQDSEQSKKEMEQQKSELEQKQYIINLERKLKEMEKTITLFQKRDTFCKDPVHPPEQDPPRTGTGVRDSSTYSGQHTTTHQEQQMGNTHGDNPRPNHEILMEHIRRIENQNMETILRQLEITTMQNFNMFSNYNSQLNFQLQQQANTLHNFQATQNYHHPMRIQHPYIIPGYQPLVQPMQGQYIHPHVPTFQYHMNGPHMGPRPIPVITRPQTGYYMNMTKQNEQRHYNPMRTAPTSQHVQQPGPVPTKIHPTTTDSRQVVKDPKDSCEVNGPVTTLPGQYSQSSTKQNFTEHIDLTEDSQPSGKLIDLVGEPEIPVEPTQNSTIDESRSDVSTQHVSNVSPDESEKDNTVVTDQSDQSTEELAPSNHLNDISESTRPPLKHFLRVPSLSGKPPERMRRESTLLEVTRL
ncbi:MAG: hypothetical protein ABW185_00065 [Sedimenticola sp.]